MRHFSIARLMLAIAFLAANFGVFRCLLHEPYNRERVLLIGFLPFLDCQLIVLYLLARRYRAGIHRRQPRFGFVRAFAVVCLVVLIASVGIYGLAPDLIDDYARAVSKLKLVPIQARGFHSGLSSPFERMVLVPILLGVIFSGPPLLLSLTLAAALSVFNLIITPRVAEEAPCDDSPSSR